MPKRYPPDFQIPVKHLQFDVDTQAFKLAPQREHFIRGPIPLAWLGQAAKLPGKTLNVALALWWRQGMAKGQPFKLTRKALNVMNVERDAASAGLVRLETAGLIKVERKPGQRPMISLVTHIDVNDDDRATPCKPSNPN